MAGTDIDLGLDASLDADLDTLETGAAPARPVQVVYALGARTVSFNLSTRVNNLSLSATSYSEAV